MEATADFVATVPVGAGVLKLFTDPNSDGDSASEGELYSGFVFWHNTIWRKRHIGVVLDDGDYEEVPAGDFTPTTS